jgi:hypothetical protein
MNFSSQELAWTYYQCLAYAITTYFYRSFLLSLALKTKNMYQGTIGPDPIEI